MNNTQHNEVHEMSLSRKILSVSAVVGAVAGFCVTAVGGIAGGLEVTDAFAVATAGFVGGGALGAGTYALGKRLRSYCVGSQSEPVVAQPVEIIVDRAPAAAEQKFSATASSVARSLSASDPSHSGVVGPEVGNPETPSLPPTREEHNHSPAQDDRALATPTYSRAVVRDAFENKDDHVQGPLQEPIVVLPNRAVTRVADIMRTEHQVKATRIVPRSPKSQEEQQRDTERKHRRGASSFALMGNTLVDLQNPERTADIPGVVSDCNDNGPTP